MITTDYSWSEPRLLSDYLRAPRETGVYLIGEMREAGLPNDAQRDDNFLGRGWPDGFFPHYIGRSSGIRGVRCRLSAHARKKGNKCVAGRVDKGEDLYFICKTGKIEFLLLERILQASLGEGTLSCNVRVEWMFSDSRVHDLINKHYKPRGR